MIVSLSWRNVWRNKLRSSVIIVATTLGICAGIFSAAFYQGMADQRIEKAIRTELSHIQVHRKEFRNSNEIKDYISDADKLNRKISQIDGVVGVSNRLVIFSMVSSAETGSGVKIVGIDPEKEKLTTNIHQKLKEGSYFEEKRRNQVLIGEKLAEKLKVKLNSKVVITLLDVDNNITYGAFRVVGIFNTVNNAFDEANIFVRHNDLSKLIDLPPDACHEIAIYVSDNDRVESVKARVEQIAGDLEVMSWLNLSPEMSYLNEAMDLFMYIFIIIILLALLFGIINTMLMVVLERVKEIGMLMAVGMNKIRIFLMILLETVFLSLTGGAIGVAAGTMLSNYFETRPINLAAWADAYTDLGYDPFVYTSLNVELLINVTVMVLVTGVLASLYPAYKALRQDPSDALRTE
ncbi:MAG: ABC transporter permease [Cytophagales bacterium]|nr:ABC transporter permease [Cytophagales bacterium]